MKREPEGNTKINTPRKIFGIYNYYQEVENRAIRFMNIWNISMMMFLLVLISGFFTFFVLHMAGYIF